MSILQTINAQRKIDVEKYKIECPLENLLEKLKNPEFSQIDFLERISQSPSTGAISIMAELKRASPSKGDIALNIDATVQGLQYAQAGAAVISVLTEPKWFKTTLEDLRSIRRAIDQLPNRPAILRKEFIVDEYQIYEARVYGADSLLLIVASLTDDQLIKFLSLSRSLHMEPLVEVANTEEMTRALKIGAKIIGINNRDLHTFSVNLETTTALVSAVVEGGKKTEQSTVPENSSIIFAALSGISNRADVARYEEVGIRAVLVGESLMKSLNPTLKIRELRGDPLCYVKICGIKDVDTAIATAEAGAEFIGLVFVEGSRRQVSLEKAREIAGKIREWRKAEDTGICVNWEQNQINKGVGYWYKNCSQMMAQVLKKVRPLIVGVFANNSIEFINQVAKEVPLDIVQLHGKEGWDIGHQIPIPSWRAIHVPPESSADQLLSQFQPGPFLSLLLDTATAGNTSAALGGTGLTFDWSKARSIQRQVPIILAGGLTPENVSEAILDVAPFAVDVSSGVETNGVKDLAKISQFIKTIRNLQV